MTVRFARVVLVLVSLSLMTLAAASYEALAKGGNGNPRVIPPNAKYRGLTYGEWEAKWQQAAFAIPVEDGDHPVFSGGAFGGEDGVLFLSGVTGGVTIDLTIPAGTALFFPIIVAECSDLEAPPFFGADEAEQAACANLFIDDVSDLDAEIDGRTVQNLEFYRTQSPQYTFSVPESNILGLPEAATGTSVSVGYYLLVAPLSVGTHTIHFTGTYAPFDYKIDITYNITVVP